MTVRCTARAAFFLFAALGLAGCNSRTNHVVVYTSQDREYAEPVFQKFATATGIEVRPVYDNEAIKTVGIVNRLLAESGHPQCDLFWNNEELRTRQLAAKGLVDKWHSMGTRRRQLVVRSTPPRLAIPGSLNVLTNPAYRGKIILAYPLFGTTADHFLFLRQIWGERRWMAWCGALIANKPMLVDGNSTVVKMVAQGEAIIGLTDSDDIAAGIREGWPVQGLMIEEEGLAIPNTVALIRGAPHAEAGVRLFEYLQGEPVRNFLVQHHALDAPLAGSSGLSQEQWLAVLSDLDRSMAQMKQMFLR